MEMKLLKKKIVAQWAGSEKENAEEYTLMINEYLKRLSDEKGARFIFFYDKLLGEIHEAIVDAYMSGQMSDERFQETIFAYDSIIYNTNAIIAENMCRARNNQEV